MLYACDSNGMLYTVDPSSGETVEVGEVTGSPCNNLAAPFAPVECVSNP